MTRISRHSPGPVHNEPARPASPRSRRTVGEVTDGVGLGEVDAGDVGVLVGVPDEVETVGEGLVGVAERPVVVAGGTDVDVGRGSGTSGGITGAGTGGSTGRPVGPGLVEGVPVDDVLLRVVELLSVTVELSGRGG